MRASALSVPVPTRDRRSYAALLSLVKLAGLLRKAGDRFFRSYGLTQSQFNVLMVLSHQTPRGCRQCELARRLLVRAANTTELVRRLAARGWIEREDDPADERAWRVRITEAGRGILRRVEAAYYRQIDRIMQVHSEKELSRFSAQLERTQEVISRLAM